MSAIDSPYYGQIMQTGAWACPDGSEQEQESIGRRALCYTKRLERQKDLGFKPESEQNFTKIPKSEAIRMLQESREDLEEKLALIRVAAMRIEEDHPELQEILS